MEHVINNRDGQISKKNSYGKDPKTSRVSLGTPGPLDMRIEACARRRTMVVVLPAIPRISFRARDFCKGQIDPLRAFDGPGWGPYETGPVTGSVNDRRLRQASAAVCALGTRRIGPKSSLTARTEGKLPRCSGQGYCRAAPE